MIDIKTKLRQLLNHEITEFSIIELNNSYSGFKTVNAISEDNKEFLYGTIGTVPTSVRFYANKLTFSLTHQDESIYRPEAIHISKKRDYILSATSWDEFMIALNVRGISYMNCVDNCTSSFRSEKLETIDINKIITKILREEFMMPKSSLEEEYEMDSAAPSGS